MLTFILFFAWLYCAYDEKADGCLTVVLFFAWFISFVS
jgi:hypothetical protein